MRNTATPDDPGLDPVPDGERLFARLHDDHLDIADRLAALATHDATVAGARGAALDELSRHLETHLAAEEATLYPAIRKVGLLVSFVERMVIQHDVIRSALKGLVDARDAEASMFAEAVGYLQRVTTEHVEEEEGSFFAYARANLGGEIEAIERDLERFQSASR